MNNYKQLYARKKANEERIRRLLPHCPTESGIYVFTREEDGFKYAYVGQSNNLLRRLGEHLAGYQRIDLSIKKHGLFSDKNPCGWKIQVYVFPTDELDVKEQDYIRLYARNGYQMRNDTTGGQGEGKKALGEAKTGKGYYDGVRQGYKNAQKEIAHLFDLHLTFDTKKHPATKTQEKAAEKFKKFLQGIEL